MRFVSVLVVHPYSSTDTATGWKRSSFMLSVQYQDWFPFKIISTRIMTVSVLLWLSGRVIPQVFLKLIVIKKVGGKKNFCCKDLFFSMILFTCYFEPNLAQYVWVYSYKILRKTSNWFVYLFNLSRPGGKGRMLFLIDQFHFKSLLAVAFRIFLGVSCAVLRAWRTFYFRIAGWNNSFGRANIMLEDPKLVRTPRTSLTRWFCAPFLRVWLQYIYLYIHTLLYLY